MADDKFTLKVEEDLLNIDYGLIEQPLDAILNDWEPPKHVYFGKKLPNGKLAPEPIYSHQEFPRMVYAKQEGRIRARIAHNAEELFKLEQAGFVKTMMELGIETHPSKEDRETQRIAKEGKKEVEIKTETVLIV